MARFAWLRALAASGSFAVCGIEASELGAGGVPVRRARLFFGVVSACSIVVAVAAAAPPDSAPAECKKQVANALKALDPVLGGSRKLQKGAAGTIEAAIAAYVPARMHPVDEGTLPATHAAGTCPSEMANVANRFCIDKWEDSLVEKLADGSTKAWSPYQSPADGKTFVAKSASGAVPQGYVSASTAEKSCKEAGKRLCQPVEWRAACGGSNGYAYPYGGTRSEGKCHDKGAAPMVTYHADTMSKGWGLAELNDPRNNQLDGGLALTGASADCVNDYGVYDMVGNLHEWTADKNGTFQGGYWLDTSQHGDGCAYRTIAHGYDYHDYSTGFRCCADLP